MRTMHRTLWTLLFALLLQLLVGTAWGGRSSPADSGSAHCHTMVHDATAASDEHPTVDSSHTPERQQHNHHCCAMGTVAPEQALVVPWPQAIPSGPHGSWASVSLPPDLRPPI